MIVLIFFKLVITTKLSFENAQKYVHFSLQKLNETTVTRFLLLADIILPFHVSGTDRPIPPDAVISFARSTFVIR